jgi:large subunit ribosomal protein L22
MLITATQKNVRQTPRKVRLVANSVRKLPLEAAIAQLGVINRIASVEILKTIRQAVANATNNLGLSMAELKLDNIIVEEGSIYRRMRAVSRGRGHGIDKKTCHIKVTLEKVAVIQPQTQSNEEKES